MSTDKGTPFREALALLRESQINPWLTPVEAARKRESALAAALLSMAAELGVTLRGPLIIDSRGEFMISAAPAFGEVFAQYLTDAQARTGFPGPNHLIACNTWCYLNHFGAERMVLAYAEANPAGTPNSIYDAMKAAGVPVDNHESDLYVPVNATTRAILEKYPTQKANARTFTNQVAGGLWYDIPFAFKPWWDARAR